MRTNVSWIGIVIGLLLHSGCSWLFVKGPPADHARDPYFECTEDVVWPVMDTIWAGLNGLGAASVAGDNTNPNQTQILLVGTAWVVVSGMAAIYGFRKSSDCREAKHQRDVRYGRGMVAPGMPGPGPVPEAAPAPASAGAAPGAPPRAAPAPAAPSTAPAAPAAPSTAPVAPAAPGTAPAHAGSAAPSTGAAPGSAPSPSASRRFPTAPGRTARSRSLAMRPVAATE